MQEQQQIPPSVRRQQQSQQMQLGDITQDRSWATPIEMLIALAIKQLPENQLLRRDVEAGLRALCADPIFGAEDLRDHDVEAVRHAIDTLLTDISTRSEAFNLSILALKLETERDPLAIPAFIDAGRDDDERDAAWIGVGVVALALQAARDPDNIVLSRSKPKRRINPRAILLETLTRSRRPKPRKTG